MSGDRPWEPRSHESVRSVLARQQTAVGRGGVVAAAAPIAASIGAQMLRDGGNAYDAAVAAALAESVLLPLKCGLAGDLVALCLEPGATEPQALTAIGPAAGGLAKVAQRGALTTTGPTSVGVPAAPAGYAELAARGRFGREAVAGPAMALARDGFAWSPVLEQLTRSVVGLLKQHNPAGTAYLPNGEAIPAGSTVRLPGLAAALREWVDRGSEMMTGPVGEALSNRVIAAGGVITPADLASARVEWQAAEMAQVGEMRIWSTPAPTFGPSLLACCSNEKFLGGVDGIWRAVVEAMKQRERTLSDPLHDEGTSAVGCVDAEGRVVVIIHSNSFPRFGSGIVLEEYQLILSNRAGRGFNSTPGHSNFPSQGKRPATTLHAWAAGNGRVELMGGTPGGINQMIWNAQTLKEIFLGAKDPGPIVTAPRWAWDPPSKTIFVESDSDPEVIKYFASSTETGSTIVPPLSLHSVQLIAVVPSSDGPRVIAVDPREGATAVAAF